MRRRKTMRADVSRGCRRRPVWPALLALVVGVFVMYAAARAAPTGGEPSDLPSFTVPNIMAIVMSLAVLAIACMRYRKD